MMFCQKIPILWSEIKKLGSHSFKSIIHGYCIINSCRTSVLLVLLFTHQGSGKFLPNNTLVRRYKIDAEEELRRLVEYQEEEEECWLVSNQVYIVLIVQLALSFTTSTDTNTHTYHFYHSRQR